MSNPSFDEISDRGASSGDGDGDSTGAHDATDTGGDGGSTSGESSGTDVGDCAIRTWFYDEDGDGFGAGEPMEACQAPEGYVEREGDCADEDGAVSPDADEVCDDVDNDCDGKTDEFSLKNTACGGCEAVLVDGEAYAVCRGDPSFMMAASMCTRFGGALVTISGDAHNGALSEVLVAERIASAWIGMWRGVGESGFEWLAQPGVTVEEPLPWMTGEPTDGGNCVAMSGVDDEMLGEWFAVPCADMQPAALCMGLR